MFVKRGTIEGFAGSWGSGLGFLTISGEAVPCDNGCTVRALRDAFAVEDGDVITDNHTVNGNGTHIGQEIIWWYGEFGMILGGFMPAWAWDTQGFPDIPAEGLDFVAEPAVEDEEAYAYAPELVIA